MPEVSLSVDQHTKAWAAAAGLSEKELKRVEAEGPRAAHLLLASVERLLYQISQRCYAAVRVCLSNLIFNFSRRISFVSLLSLI